MRSRRLCVLTLVALGVPVVRADAAPLIAYTHGETIHVIRADGSGDRQLIPQPKLRPSRACGPQIADYAPAWSPDGTQIAFVRYGCALHRQQRGIWIARADGSGAHRVVAGFQPSWAPDGRRLAIIRPTRSVPDVFVVNADGSGLAQIANDATTPSWSPDGSTIAFAAVKLSGPELALVAPDGSGLTSTGAGGIDPDWSPDGKRIAYMDGGTGIEVLDLASGVHTRLAPGGSRPAWSPDGTQIAFVRQRRSGRHNLRSIYVMNADGSSPRLLRNGIEPDWRP